MGVYTDPRNNRLFIQFRLRGEIYKERLPAGTTRKEAEVIELKVKSQWLFESHGIEAQREDQTFERFIQDVYLPHVEANHSPASFERSIQMCKAALPYLKGKQMRSIKPADIERFKVSRMNTNTMHGTARKPATVARELSIISRIFSLAVTNDICDYNPCSRVEKPKFDNVMDKVLRIEDEQKLFDNMFSEWARDICKVVLHTGLRQNDVMNLTRFQIDLRSGWIRLTQGKTKRQVIIAINADIAPILERRMKIGTKLFLSPRTGRKGTVRNAMLRACRRAKIEPLTIRDLRRTFATRLYENGIDSVTIARMLGHSDLRSIHRYERSLEMMRKAAETLSVKQPTTMPNAEWARKEVKS